MKAAFYGRFSTDLQNDESIEDQRWACQRHIESLGGELVQGCEYADFGISGQILNQRPGVTALIEAAQRRNRPFDTIIVRQLSRLSRDVGDTFAIFKILKFHDIRLLTCDGFDSTSSDAEFRLFVEAFTSATYIKSVKQNVKISLLRRFENGFSTGGKTLGYTSRPVYSEKTGIRRGQSKPVGYELIPDPEEVPIVRRTFELAKKGYGSRTLTRAINEEFPGYGLSTSGISRLLRNKIYVGVRIYNRLEVQFHPVTHKVVFKKRPPEQWITVCDKKLAIIDQGLFDEVQLILDDRKTERVHTPPATKFLLSDLLICGSCKSSFAIADHDNYTCRSDFFGRGCDNDIRINRIALETIILRQLSQHLEEYVERLLPLMTQIVKAKQDDLFNKEARLRKLQREKDNLLSFMRLEGVAQEASKELSREFNRVCQQIKELEQMPDVVPMDTEVKYDPAVLRDFLARLPQALTANLPAGRTLLRQILTKVTIHPGAPRRSICPICKKERRLNGKHTGMHGFTRLGLLREYPAAGFTRDCRLEMTFNPDGMMAKFLSADLSIMGSGKEQIITLDPLIVHTT
jgi:DNA invertase Pin-like site-specific DNA recombinase